VAGIVVAVDGAARAITAADGSFEVQGVAPGTRTVRASMAGYLCAEQALDVASGGPVDLGRVELRGGDIVVDDRVDIFDLAAIGAEYGNSAPRGSRADVNLDGQVGVLDLVLVTANYGATCPTSW
jgi:hypothetical protein